jgi:hypothetical protein
MGLVLMAHLGLYLARWPACKAGLAFVDVGLYGVAVNQN